MKTNVNMLAAAVAIALLVSCAMTPPAPTDTEITARTVAMMKKDFAKLGPGWVARIDQDEVQALCTAHRDHAPKDVAEKIEKSQLATIQYPATPPVGELVMENQLDMSPKFDAKLSPVSVTIVLPHWIDTCVTRPPSCPSPLRPVTVTAWSVCPLEQ